VDGPLAGTSLGEAFSNHSEAMLGPNALSAMQGSSPLLIKVIFAREKLSVQVHPDDRLAQKYGQPRGKTECWYALAADPGAQVACGLKPGVTLKQIEAEVANGSLESSLNVLQIESGDMVFVDAGTVHAIWPGSVLLETQQNCDITYRLYDYGRPRELHVAKALEATRLETNAGKVPPVKEGDRTILVDRDYFCVEKIAIETTRTGKSMSRSSEQAAGLSYLFAAKGAAQISPANRPDFHPVRLSSGSIVAIPASSPEWAIENLGGLDLIRITPRWPATSGHQS
jgi:mannose-6-phosphate isomerase